MATLNLTMSLSRALQQRPDKLATIFRDRRRTYREFGDRVARLAGALRKLGMGAGDRVAMFALNSDRYLEYYYGVWWGGGAVNPVNTRWSAAEIAYSLDDCDTRILLIDDNFLPMLGELRQRAKSLQQIVYVGDGPAPEGLLDHEALIAQADAVDDAVRANDEVAGVYYTGGTTGFPKGVMLTHSGLLCNSLMLIAEGMCPEDTIGLHSAPMFHLADGMFQGMLALRQATQVFLPQFNPQEVMKAIEAERVTAAVLVPTMIQMLVDHPSIGDYRLDSMRLMIYGGSPINQALLGRAMQRLPQTQFTQLYGMTEMSPVSTLLPPGDHVIGAKRLSSGGRATFTSEVRIVDELGHEVPRGTIGEIAARGPGVMKGYWNKPEETAAVLRNGWMHTGDGGYMDEDGYLFIVDRVKDMIVTGGENVYSIEVENAIARHPSVASCAVIGIPSEQWGETVHGVVVLKPGEQLDAEALKAHCKTLIANYKCPRSVEFVAALPVSGTGKVLKNKLREPFWAGRERRVG
jgi:long-chain acyl-CoA synthetase